MTLAALQKRFRIFKLDGWPVRGLIDDHGGPWIAAMDLAAPLAIKARQIRKFSKSIGDPEARLLIGEEFAGVEKLRRRGTTRAGGGNKEFLPPPSEKSPKGGGANKVIALSESAVNALIVRSNDAIKPGTFAHRFRTWVFGEVLPSLRKHGSYFVNRRAREIMAALPGWEEARAEGKDARRSFADHVADFAAYATAQGSNHDDQYYTHFTNLAHKCALGLASFPPPARDLLDQNSLRRIAFVEEALGELIAAVLQEGLEYHAAYREISERFMPAFVRSGCDAK